MPFASGSLPPALPSQYIACSPVETFAGPSTVFRQMSLPDTVNMLRTTLVSGVLMKVSFPAPEGLTDGAASVYLIVAPAPAAVGFGYVNTPETVSIFCAAAGSCP